MVISSGCDPEIPSSILGCGTLFLNVGVNNNKLNPEKKGCCRRVENAKLK
jgi:hypothetical protein